MTGTVDEIKAEIARAALRMRQASATMRSERDAWERAWEWWCELLGALAEAEMVVSPAVAEREALKAAMLECEAAALAG